MDLATREAAVSGTCYACHRPYEAGDYLACLGEDILCPECVTDHRELNAA